MKYITQHYHLFITFIVNTSVHQSLLARPKAHNEDLRGFLQRKRGYFRPCCDVIQWAKFRSKLSLNQYYCLSVRLIIFIYYFGINYELQLFFYLACSHAFLMFYDISQNVILSHILSEILTFYEVLSLSGYIMRPKKST